MANTASLVKDIYPYVIKRVSELIDIELKERKLYIGNPKREKKFDGVSCNGNVVVSVFTSSGYSKSGKLPVGKINALYATCYMMNLTESKRRILAFTNSEFYEIIRKKTEGFLIGFEMIYIELPDELKNITDSVSKEASDEMA